MSAPANTRNKGRRRGDPARRTAFDALRAERWTRALPTRWLVAFYGANLLLPVGMSVAVGLWGAVVATGVALAVAWLIARAGRTNEVAA